MVSMTQRRSYLHRKRHQIKQRARSSMQQLTTMMTLPKRLFTISHLRSQCTLLEMLIARLITMVPTILAIRLATQVLITMDITVLASTKSKADMVVTQVFTELTTEEMPLQSQRRRAKTTSQSRSSRILTTTITYSIILRLRSRIHIFRVAR
jgi:hypothetical protein